MPFSTSDGAALWTTTTGSASSLPPVVILHGGPGLWDDYAVLAEMLDDLTVVHRFDQRGCGRSGPSELQSVRRTAQDIDELREYFGHERIVVLGHSFGATLALAYAGWHGDRTAGVVYVGGVGIGDWRTPERAERARRMTPAQVARLDELGEKRGRTAEEELEFRVLAWFPDYADQSMAMTWARRSAAVELPINFAANRELGQDVSRWPEGYLAGLAAGLSAPVTFVHGAGDPRSVVNVRDLASHTPRHTFHLIPDAGHSPWLERPELFREVLREAVQGC
ncbi:alpha/beta hydrolase [Kribbella capetownensis]|uniref:Alpha/beta hydrolase n=1 Tax=Kribbella capetownensis TaxID=1572659 RepID=A0A4R0JGG8_9ACTN|nr:alpha/beta hydrolase [Kribbella capetownensis]TCC45180.1 alpha/beta hydrolase [Kribbella capetownensis]